MKPTYYGIRLNVPWSKADAIKSLVPDGAPMSGTLIAILLEVAKQRGYEHKDETDEVAALRHTVQILSKRVCVLEERLDHMARGPR